MSLKPQRCQRPCTGPKTKWTAYAEIPRETYLSDRDYSNQRFFSSNLAHHKRQNGGFLPGLSGASFRLMALVRSVDVLRHWHSTLNHSRSRKKQSRHCQLIPPPPHYYLDSQRLTEFCDQRRSVMRWPLTGVWNVENTLYSTSRCLISNI